MASNCEGKAKRVYVDLLAESQPNTSAALRSASTLGTLRLRIFLVYGLLQLFLNQESERHCASFAVLYSQVLPAASQSTIPARQRSTLDVQ